MWNPWGEVGRRWPRIDIVWWLKLPGGVRGLVDGDTIWLCRSLTQAERRCTLTHELVHLERGITEHPDEERVVDAAAARRLITLPALAAALRWTRQPAELADALWVDEPTLRTRMDTLDPIEVAELEYALEDEWLWIP